jgi:hypothetical protein
MSDVLGGVLIVAIIILLMAMSYFMGRIDSYEHRRDK